MRTLLLAADNTPETYVSAEEAILKVIQEKAYVVEIWPDHEFRSAGNRLTGEVVVVPVPKTIIASRYHPRPSKFYGPAPLTNEGLFLRDDYTCQYCGRHVSQFRKGEKLEREHIFPQSRGGPNTWENCTTACTTCNGRKMDRTPAEAGMKLISKPVPMTRHQLEELRKLSKQQRVA